MDDSVKVSVDEQVALGVASLLRSGVGRRAALAAVEEHREREGVGLMAMVTSATIRAVRLEERAAELAKRVLRDVEDKPTAGEALAMARLLPDVLVALLEANAAESALRALLNEESDGGA